MVPRWGRGGTGLLVPGRLSQGVSALTSPPAANRVWHRDLSVFPHRPVVPSGFLRSPTAAKLPYLVPGPPWQTRGGDSGGVVSAPVKAGSTGFSTTSVDSCGFVEKCTNKQSDVWMVGVDKSFRPHRLRPCCAQSASVLTFCQAAVVACSALSPMRTGPSLRRGIGERRCMTSGRGVPRSTGHR